MGFFSWFSSSHKSSVKQPTPAKAAANSASDTPKSVHLVLGDPLPGSVDTSPVITVEALSHVDNKGMRKDNLTIYAGADPLSMLEAGAALYWNAEIEDRQLPLEVAIRWLNEARRLSANPYLGHLAEDAVPVQSQVLTALAYLSLDFAIGQIDHPKFVSAARTWFLTATAPGKSHNRTAAVERARRLKLVLAELEPELVAHLHKSVRL